MATPLTHEHYSVSQGNMPHVKYTTLNLNSKLVCKSQVCLPVQLCRPQLDHYSKLNCRCTTIIAHDHYCKLDCTTIIQFTSGIDSVSNNNFRKQWTDAKFAFNAPK